MSPANLAIDCAAAAGERASPVSLSAHGPRAPTGTQSRRVPHGGAWVTPLTLLIDMVGVGGASSACRARPPPQPGESGPSPPLAAFAATFLPFTPDRCCRGPAPPRRRCRGVRMVLAEQSTVGGGKEPVTGSACCRFEPYVHSTRKNAAVPLAAPLGPSLMRTGCTLQQTGRGAVVRSNTTHKKGSTANNITEGGGLAQAEHAAASVEESRSG